MARQGRKLHGKSMQLLAKLGAVAAWQIWVWILVVFGAPRGGDSWVCCAGAGSCRATVAGGVLAGDVWLAQEQCAVG